MLLHSPVRRKEGLTETKKIPHPERGNGNDLFCVRDRGEDPEGFHSAPGKSFHKKSSERKFRVMRKRSGWERLCRLNTCAEHFLRECADAGN